jgi:hypothetical protein
MCERLLILPALGGVYCLIKQFFRGKSYKNGATGVRIPPSILLAIAAKK